MIFIRGGGGGGDTDNDIELIILMSTAESWTARGAPQQLPTGLQRMCSC